MVVKLPPELLHHRFTVDDYHRMIELAILTEDHPVELIRGEVVYKSEYRSPEFHHTPYSERYRFTVNEYERLVSAGILTKADRVELIRGEVVKKMSIGPRHAAACKRLIHIFTEQTRGRATIGAQDPVHLADSEPEPDISVVRPSRDFYAMRHPIPEEIYLVVEVADSSLADDRNVQGPLYAENGISEYWIVDLTTDTVSVHRNPRSDGTWADVTTHPRGDSLDIAALPGVTVAVADILP